VPPRTASTGTAPATTTGGTNFFTATHLTGTDAGSLLTDRSHYYAITVNAGDTVTVTLQPQEGDHDIYVYDMFQRLQGKSENYGTASDTCSFTAAYSGTYFVQVYAYEAGAYTVSAQGVTTTQPTGDTTPAGTTRSPGFGLVIAFAAIGITAGTALFRSRGR